MMKIDQHSQALSELIWATRNLILDQKRAGHHGMAISNTTNLPTKDRETSVMPDASLPSLVSIQMQAQDCQLCSLHQHRNQVVFGSGGEKMDLMVVTPPPSPEEDIKGQPLLGEAGQLFSNMLSAIGLSRGQVYITPVVKCKTAQGSYVEKQHISACHGYLMQQIQIIQPAMVLALGQMAGQSVTKQTTTLDQLRNKLHQVGGTETIVTFEPSFLVDHPEAKKEAWEDMKSLHAMICKKTGKKLTRKG